MTAKILIIDIERTRGKAEVNFWDLGDFKDRRIQHKDVTKWPETICFAYRWYGEARIGFHSNWNDTHRGMLQAAWNLYDEADIVVGHNIAGFDNKKIKAEWIAAGFRPPSPWKNFDTLTVARKEFGFESNTLDSLCVRLGIQGKTDKYDPDIAEQAVAGDRLSQLKIQGYNEGDVVASTALYEKLVPWGSHPHVGLFTDNLEPVCPGCGSVKLQKRGTATTTTGIYPRHQCQDCGKWSRGRESIRTVDIRTAS